MNKIFSAKGQCLCGVVQLEAPSASVEMHACHCGICRKWSGGALLAIGVGAEIKFNNEENIGAYTSSEWAERGFCKLCGTHLFYRMQDKSQYYIPVGIFDDASNIVFEAQMFIDKKPAYYSFANETKLMTEAQMLALWGD